MEGDWTTRAACRGVSLNTFFGDSARDAKQARWFCDRCPVTGDCLAMAESLDGSEAHGIFGGLTGKQRTAIRQARQREPA